MSFASNMLGKSKTMKVNRRRKNTEPDDEYNNFGYSLVEHRQQGKNKKSDSSTNQSKERKRKNLKHPGDYKGGVSRENFKKRGRAATDLFKNQ